jgi:hypothetical protein
MPYIDSRGATAAAFGSSRAPLTPPKKAAAEAGITGQKFSGKMIGTIVNL